MRRLIVQKLDEVAELWLNLGGNGTYWCAKCRKSVSARALGALAKSPQARASSLYSPEVTKTLEHEQQRRDTDARSVSLAGLYPCSPRSLSTPRLKPLYFFLFAVLFFWVHSSISTD